MNEDRWVRTLDAQQLSKGIEFAYADQISDTYAKPSLNRHVYNTRIMNNSNEDKVWFPSQKKTCKVNQYHKDVNVNIGSLLDLSTFSSRIETVWIN